MGGNCSNESYLKDYKNSGKNKNLTPVTDEYSFVDFKESSRNKKHNEKEVDALYTANMISREELDAKLSANIETVKAVASETRAEMEKLRADVHVSVSDVKRDISEIKAMLNASLPNMATKAEVSSEITKSTHELMKWIIGLVIALAALMVTLFQLGQSSPATTPQPHQPAAVMSEQSAQQDQQPPAKTASPNK